MRVCSTCGAVGGGCEATEGSKHAGEESEEVVDECVECLWRECHGEAMGDGERWVGGVKGWCGGVVVEREC